MRKNEIITLRTDTEEEKRIELHARTGMSMNDGIASASDYLRRAAAWGHEALAIADTGVTQAFPEAFRAARETGVRFIPGCGVLLVPSEDTPPEGGFAAVLLAMDRTGLVNLNRLVSRSLTRPGGGIPRLTRDEIESRREGLLVGSAFCGGEASRAVLRNAPREEAVRAARYYDYIEIEPPENGSFPPEEARRLIRALIALADDAGTPAAAVSDARYVDPEDGIARAVLRQNAGLSDDGDRGSLCLRTTREMLDAFAFLGAEKAREAVIAVPRRIAERIDPGLTLFPPEAERFPPLLPEARDRILSLARSRALALYGGSLPDPVERRLAFESACLERQEGFSLFEIARRCAVRSREDGFPVGSRGCAGASLIAFLCGITDVDPLPPHYRCPVCGKSIFDEALLPFRCGADLPEKACPACGQTMAGEGFDIPPESFFGLGGEREPDVDLNFAAEEAGRIRALLSDTFGRDRVFRAGTVITRSHLPSKRIVDRYLETHPRTEADPDRIASLIEGVKTGSGQHPAAVVILPEGRDINEFTPVHFLPGDPEDAVPVTHYDYYSISGTLGKLDVLTQEAPALLRMSLAPGGPGYGDVPLGDKGALSLFLTPDALGVTEEEILWPTGTAGIPGYRPRFVRDLISVLKPASVEELLRLEGFSHGVEVWPENAEEMIGEGWAASDCPAAREDIMNDLVRAGLPREQAYRIMDSVRRGRGVTRRDAEDILGAGLPEWYPGYLQRIRYMFPRAHSAHYLTHSLKLAWLKIYRPAAFYAAVLTLKKDAAEKGDLTADEKSLRGTILSLRAEAEEERYAGRRVADDRREAREEVLQLLLEMKARGIALLPPDPGRGRKDAFTAENGAVRLPAAEGS